MLLRTHLPKMHHGSERGYLLPRPHCAELLPDANPAGSSLQRKSIHSTVFRLIIQEGLLDDAVGPSSGSKHLPS